MHPGKGFAQWKDFTISPKGDTLNCLDKQDRRQGRWVNHFDELRGEPGYEEEGVYKNGRKEGTWRLYSLQGDLIGVEFYKWGNKDGVCQYFGINGTLLREEGWRALNEARFTADANPATNIDAGRKGPDFFLATGGPTENVGTPLRGTIERAVPVDAAPPADLPQP